MNSTVALVANSSWFIWNFHQPLLQVLLSGAARVVIVAPEDDYSDGLRDLGVEVMDWRLHRASRSPSQALGDVRDLVGAYSRIQPRVVHHFTVKPNTYGSLAARLARVPKVVNSWEGLGYLFDGRPKNVALGRIVSPLMRAGCNRANVVNIFYNKTDRDELVSMGIVSPEGCMFLPGVGIDINAYGQTPTESTTESVSPLVLMGCRLIHQKGVADFLEAAAMLSASGFEASFAIAGSPDEGNPDSIPTSQIAEWKAKYPVEFLGHVNDMPGLLARTSIAVLPTRYREGMPRFLLEASAAGVPAVATDTQGCREVVVDGQTGLLVKPGDVEALASAIKRVLESRETHARMSVAARSRAVSTFSTEHVTTAYEELYQSLLNAA